MAKGTAKWFNDSKGFGFTTKEDGEDIFVHHTSIAGSGFKSLSKVRKSRLTLKKGRRAFTQRTLPRSDTGREAAINVGPFRSSHAQSSDALISGPDHYDIPVLNDILLAFEPPNPCLFAGGEIPVAREVLIGHGLRPYESL